MALGAGSFTSQNEVLPGTYINFTSPLLVSQEQSLRGIVALPRALSWGKLGEVFAVDNTEVSVKSEELFGKVYTDDEMLEIREVFRNANKAFVYRLGTGGVKAESAVATAKYVGDFGNNIFISVKNSVDNLGEFTVETYVNNNLVDAQNATSSAELISNAYVDFKGSELAVTVKSELTGGSNPTVTGDDYLSFLNAIGDYSFNTLICPSSDDTTKNMFVTYTKGLYEESGANFQLVCHKVENVDHETVVSVENDTMEYKDKFALVYWVAGALAKAGVGESLTSKLYDGELTIDTDYSQSELSGLIKDGKFVLHIVNGEPKVLKDINTFISYTDTKGNDFSSNQTVRICMGLASEISLWFNNYYLGKVANDESGRTSLWNDICKILSNYQNERAIDSFTPESVSVNVGENKRSVVCSIENLLLAGAMETLYMNVVII